MQITHKSILIASLGTMFEYYDVAIFAIFLPILSPILFPGHSKYESLVIGFYALLIASIARPIGGLAFGYIGDTYGRKKSLLISMYGIAIATLLIGLIPGANTLGIWSMVLVIMVRAFQALCYGGEYNGAGTYVVELANGHKEGLAGSILSAMALVGSVIAPIIGLILTFFNKSSPNWRLAFILGGVAGLIAVHYRRNMQESITPSELKQKLPFFKFIASHCPELLACICIGGFITTSFTSVVVFINPVLVTNGYIDNQEFMSLQLMLSVIAVITLLISGLYADIYTPKKIMKFAATALILGAYPLSLLIASHNLGLIILGEIGLIIINEALLGPANAFLKSLFPIQYRYRATAFCFCLGWSIMGGLTPVVENYLYKQTHKLSSIAIWLIFIGVITWMSLMMVKINKKSRIFMKVQQKC